MPVYCLAVRRATCGPYRPPIDGPFRRAENGPPQMRKPAPTPPQPKIWRVAMPQPPGLTPDNNICKEEQLKWSLSAYVLQSNCLFVPSFESEPPVRCMSKTERLRITFNVRVVPRAPKILKAALRKQA